MTSRRRAGHSKQLECTKEDVSLDRISMLPDEVLVLILSHLTFKEAAATSVLSQQWRYLWLLTPKLDFNDKVSLVKVKLANRNHAVLEKVRSNFVIGVNRFIALREDFPIKELKVSFDLSRAYKVCIDAWLKYALEMNVETLELNFSNGGFDGCDVKDFYVFPFGILHKEPLAIMHFTNLRKISLAYVDVSDFVINSLLHNSPLLEDLSVSLSRKLSVLRIRGPFFSLKSLELIWCPNLKRVEICDVRNLVCLKFAGDKLKKFIFHKVPMLVDMFLTTLDYDIGTFVRQFSSILPQLERLQIHICGLLNISSQSITAEMSNLKQLVVIYVGNQPSSELPLTNLINAAPRLEKFVFKMTRLHVQSYAYWWWWVFGGSNHHQLKDHKLKEVEFVGYRGTVHDLEFVSDLLRKAAALERITIDTREFLGFPSQLMNSRADYNRKSVMHFARKVFADKVRQGVMLEIL